MNRPLRLPVAVALAALVLAGPRPRPPWHRRGRRSSSSSACGRARDARPVPQVLGLYAPTLAGVLKLDPTLMTNEAYLAPYPALAEFLKAHPEVTRDPAYFLSFVSQYGSIREEVAPEVEARRSAVQLWSGTLDSVLFLCGFLGAIYTLTWILRYVVDHRRWLRTSRIQSDVHNRLIERMSSNAELLAYVQSPAGQRFLTAAPVAADPAMTGPAVPASAPFGRILWAVQAGLVLVSGGIGFLVIRRYVVTEVGEMMLTLGVLAVSLGVGFALAALASWAISHRLGLFDAHGPARATRMSRDGADL
ncbi:MAG: hypothetical protein R2752_20685 [Vicinamibacterales bacterium]